MCGGNKTTIRKTQQNEEGRISADVLSTGLKHEKMTSPLSDIEKKNKEKQQELLQKKRATYCSE